MTDYLIAYLNAELVYKSEPPTFDPERFSVDVPVPNDDDFLRKLMVILNHSGSRLIVHAGIESPYTPKALLRAALHTLYLALTDDPRVIQSCEELKLSPDAKLAIITKALEYAKDAAMREAIANKISATSPTASYAQVLASAESMPAAAAVTDLRPSEMGKLAFFGEGTNNSTDASHEMNHATHDASWNKFQATS